MEYYITLDVGTSSSKIAIIDTECKVIFTSTQSYPTYYPSLEFAGKIQMNGGKQSKKELIYVYQNLELRKNTLCRGCRTKLE